MNASTRQSGDDRKDCIGSQKSRPEVCTPQIASSEPANPSEKAEQSAFGEKLLQHASLIRSDGKANGDFFVANSRPGRATGWQHSRRRSAAPDRQFPSAEATECGSRCAAQKVPLPPGDDVDVEIVNRLAVVGRKGRSVVSSHGLLEHNIQIGFRLSRSNVRLQTPDQGEPGDIHRIAPVASANDFGLHAQRNKESHLFADHIAIESGAEPRR